jgi:syndecan 4
VVTYWSILPFEIINLPETDQPFLAPVAISENLGPVDHPPKPRLGEELQVTSVTQDSVSLSWTVPEGQFDSFAVQYKDIDGQPQVVPVEGSLREVSISGLVAARRYKLLLYGLHNSKRVGPLSAIVMTGECGGGQNTLCLLPFWLSLSD